MEVAAGNTHLDEAVGFLEKANADLEPELMTVPEARERLRIYAQVRRLADFGVAALAAKVESAAEVARVTGTSMGKAKDTVATGKVLGSSGELSSALKHGDVSLDQACEIARAEESSPGAATDLLTVAKEESFHVLRDKARKAKLEAEQHRDLARRQRHARSARSYSDDLGMVHIHMALEPAVGTPLVARAEAQAQRLSRAAGVHKEPFERYLADALAQMLASDDSVKGPATRPEMVMVVSHEVAQRGWTEVRAGEHCKIPGVGPIDPQEAKAIAKRAFINAVICDGKDLRQFKRWSRHIPVEIQIALELGDPPDFDGVRCVDCGNRFRTQFDHVEPVAAGGPTSNPNFRPRCWPCHQVKTAADRQAGKLRRGQRERGRQRAIKVRGRRSVQKAMDRNAGKVKPGAP